MSQLPVPSPLSETDYDAIEGAVMETARGRWFLAEYAKRNRQADTKVLLAALERIESVMRGEQTAQSVDRIRFDLVEMAKAISRTKAEIASIKPDIAHHGKFGEASEELDSIVLTTESATSDILAAAEQVQEIAWTLREQGLDSEICDLIDAKATEVYTACSFQDLTGQRTKKVIHVLRYLEGRINAMIDIWGLDGEMAEEAAETESLRRDEEGLLNGPARPGQGLDQSDVDVVMGPVVDLKPGPARLVDAIPVEPPSLDPPVHAAEAHSDASHFGERGDVRDTRAAATADFAAPSAPAGPAVTVPRPAERAADDRPPMAAEGPATRPAHDPLAPIMALSEEEKIALFG